jgi:dienelactone hydrolase
MRVRRSLLLALVATAFPVPPARAQGSTPPAARRDAVKAVLFVEGPLDSSRVERYGEFEPEPGVVAERVSYATGYRLRVPAIVYRPRQAAAVKMPGLVVVNGHGGDKTSWYSYYAGILYARAGAVVVTYDPLGEGERNAERKSRAGQHDVEVEPLPEMARRLSGLMITDVMQGVSYLSQRPDVDSTRLAVLGYSMGSFVSSLACAVDTRVKACLLAGGGNLDGPAGYWDNSKQMCQGLPYQALRFLGDRGAALYDLHAARGATLALNGTEDAVVAVSRMGAPFFDDLRRRTIALHGSDRNVFDFAFVPGGGHRPYFLTRTAAQWLERQLDFPRWTPESIAVMGETRIGEWASRHGFAERQFSNEVGEGGTRALGTEIPAVPRDSLMALPLDRWRQDQAKYVYESWVREATRAQLVAIDRGRVVAQANRYLAEPPMTVTAVRAPRSAGGPHDFFSEGDYWWPDPKDSTAPYIRRDGETNPANFVAHRDAMRRLSQIVPALVAAYEITHDARYAGQARAHLRAWFVDGATRMNPSLLFGQAIKGRFTGRGIGIIDTIHLVEVAEAARRLEELGAPDDPEIAAVRGWFRDYLTWMTTHRYGREERDNGNNHSAAYALQVAEFARFAGDSARLADMRRFFRDSLIPIQMAPDGSFPRELGRTKPYGYSLFQLDVMGMLAEVLSTPQENLWRYTTADGRGMERALSYMYPFIEDKRRWTLKPDVMYFDAWPIRHPVLLFGGLALKEPKYLSLWKGLDPDPTVDEVIRNYPVRQPVLWVR